MSHTNTHTHIQFWQVTHERKRLHECLLSNFYSWVLKFETPISQSKIKWYSCQSQNTDVTCYVLHLECLSKSLLKIGFPAGGLWKDGKITDGSSWKLSVHLLFLCFLATRSWATLHHNTLLTIICLAIGPITLKSTDHAKKKALSSIAQVFCHGAGSQLPTTWQGPLCNST
jgi:hypothetical protein